MRIITEAQIDDLMQQAAASARLRTIFRLHEHAEPVQRMVNALIPGTYVTPHEHSHPPKTELIAILRGAVAVLTFDRAGAVESVVHLRAEGPRLAVDIAPGEIHSMLALEPAAVLEIVQGPYDAATHKQFASFAPLEDSVEAADYLQFLTTQAQTER
jgi:cupin fold WbuC family metalloprotein